MPHHISLDGIDITVEGQVLEMRAQGVRNVENGLDGARLFALMENENIRAVMFDSRQADYQLTPPEAQERARLVARMSRGRIVAHIIRKDQEEQFEPLLLSHRDMGSDCRSFRSRSKGRAWIDSALAHQAEG